MYSVDDVSPQTGRERRLVDEHVRLILRFIRDRNPDNAAVPVCILCGRAAPANGQTRCGRCGGQLYADDSDYTATLSPGWRPPDWTPDGGPCVDEHCRDLHDHSPHPRGTPRWQSWIDGQVDRGKSGAKYTQHVRGGVPLAVLQLAPVDRQLIEICGRDWGSFALAGRMLRMSDVWARKRYFAALDQVEAMLWDEQGQPIYLA